MLALGSGVAYFVLGLDYWVLLALLIVTAVIRFKASTRRIGQFSEMLLFFFSVWFLLDKFDIEYPYSLILILTAAVGLIFYEGPEWSEFYFAFGTTSKHVKLAMAVALVFSLLFGGWTYFNFGDLQNPVPYYWPLDALLIGGIGFSLYTAIMNEMLFRSFIHQRARSAAGGEWAVAIQGVFYGVMHYHLPVTNGYSGVFVATLFGVTLGYLVKKSNSIYLSIVVHFVVILVVFIELVVLAKVHAP